MVRSRNGNKEGSEMARREVEPGQKYRQPGGSAVWLVVDLTSDAEGIPHARLVRSDDSTVVKMISISALKDAKMYKFVDE
jgi:hypothetical protein